MNGKKETRVKRGDTRLAVRYLDDDLLLSDGQAWTWVRLPNSHYEFLTAEDREALASRIALSLAGLLSGGMTTVDCHLIVTSRPFDIGGWVDSLNSRVARWGGKPGWNGYVHGMANHLADCGYLTKEVFLGICLGQRDKFNLSNLDLLAPIKALFKMGEKTFLMEDHEIPEKEIVDWKVKADAVRAALTGSHLAAQPASAHEVAWLISKPFWPGMICPAPTSSAKSVWGRGELESLVESVVENGHRSLKVTQVDPDSGIEVGAYTATLCVSRFPDVLHFPDSEPWMHYSSSLPFPTDWSVRFTVVPPLKAHKDVSRKLADAKDQASHVAEGGLDVPLYVQEQLQTATALEYSIKKNQTPWVYARYRIRVAADDPVELANRCKRVMDHYRDLGISVTWPSGDQLDLLCEAMPGEKVRSTAYLQRQELPLIGGGMPTASAEVGDRIERDGKGWLGPYLGEITSRMRLPAFLSPHVAMTRNASPGIAILGQPGGGKSFAAFNLAYQSALQGVWTIYIDPKADAKPMGYLPGLGNAQVFDLRAGHDGMLDPFGMGEDVNQSILLALETLRLLLGATQMPPEAEKALFSAVKLVADGPQPSLYAVVDTLRSSPDIYAQNLGEMLSILRNLPFARLCFAPSGGQRLRPEDGLTIVTLLGLDLPSAAQTPEAYSYENRLAVSVMYLLGRYARKLMLSLDKNHPKAIFIDEAWAITGTPQGAKLIPETARMGRSHNTALVLVTQNAMDLMDEQITNSISTVLAFRSRDVHEIDAVLSLLNVQVNEGTRSAIRDLYVGECLMRDVDGRVSRVLVDAWNEQLFNTFNTNPETRGKNQGSDHDPAPPQQQWAGYQ